MLKSQESPFYIQYRAQFDPRIRKLLDLRFGIPYGYRTIQNTADNIEVTIANMCEELRQQGETIDHAIMEWGWDPYTTLLIRNANTPMDPATFKRYPDMTGAIGSKKPFSPWFMQHSEAFNEGQDSDPSGVGTIFPCLFDDKFDIGAWWSESVQVMTPGVIKGAPTLGNPTGDIGTETPVAATIVKKYEKVMWRQSTGRPVGWERVL